MQIFLLDIVKRILTVVLKVRYDIETLAQKQHHMDEVMTEAILKINKEITNETTLMYNQGNDDFETLLPISNDEELLDFENKLKDKMFRSNVVCIKFIHTYMTKFKYVLYFCNLFVG